MLPKLIDLALSMVGAMALMSALLYALRPIAERIRLVDHPDDDRKLHTGIIPLTGGIALLTTLVIVFSLSNVATPTLNQSASMWGIIAACLGGLVILHAFDDVMALRAFTRFAIDALLAFFIAFYGMVMLKTLGDLFGMGEVTLGRFALLMTLFCFIAASNAFNMSDGIDSLCTGLGIICFSTIVALILLNAGASHALIPPIAIVTAALVPMYLANLGSLGPRMRTFLGDSGARLIGFMAAVALILAANEGMIRPVTAYFPIAVPVCDTLILMGWRVFHGRSPLSADRLHLHHLMVDAGYSFPQTRRLILTLAVIFASFGIGFEWSGMPTWVVSTFVVVSFWGFVGFRIWLALKGNRLGEVGDTLSEPVAASHNSN